MRFAVRMRSSVFFIFACAIVASGLANEAELSLQAYPAGPWVQVVALEYSPESITNKLRMLTRPAAAETLGAISRCAVHSSPEVRLESLRTLVRIGAEHEVRRPLIAALADVDPVVQLEAVKLLGALKSKASLPQIIAIASMTKSDDLRREALLAISAITQQ